MPPIHIGDSTHHHDQVITPVSLRTMGVTTTMGDSTPWATFQHRSAVVCGSFTLMLNTLPAYGAGFAVCHGGMCPARAASLRRAGVSTQSHPKPTR